MERFGNLRIAAPISTNSSRSDRPEMKSALANVCLLYSVSVVHLWRSASLDRRPSFVRASGLKLDAQVVKNFTPL
uniref:Uncharacterized protein n=1 Tax=Steinernema glaseri TaxID=37863 RepID=A0A1I7YQS3_9BILA